MTLASTKTIIALGIGGAGLASLEYVPPAHKKAVLIGSLAALGLGVLFLANDAKENVDAFIEEGGVWGFLGNFFAGADKKPIESIEAETPMASGDFFLTAAFQNAGTLDIGSYDDTYPADVRITYDGPAADLRFKFEIEEQGSWYGVDRGGFDAPPIAFPAGKSIRNVVFNVPILGSHPGNFSSSLTLRGGPNNKLLDAAAYKLT